MPTGRRGDALYSKSMGKQAGGWTPYTLPLMAEKAAREHFDASAFYYENLPSDPTDAERVASYAEAIHATATLLDTAPMTWMDSDVCQLIAQSAETVPEWSPKAVMPGDSGLIAFGKPVAWLDAHRPDTPGELIRDVPVDAIGWCTTNESRVVWVHIFTRDTRSRLLWTPNTPLTEIVRIDLALDGIHDGAPVVDNNTDIPQSQAMHALSTLAAVWLLMAQPTVVDEGPAEKVHVRRRPAPRRHVTGRAQVTVSTRRLTTPPPSKQRGRTGRKVTTRWWVRGHWRQQAWGKNRALRKPVWIAPHTAGHPDADVDTRPHVQVWRE